MATEEYEVEAHLRILTGGANTALARLGGRIEGLGRAIAGSGESATSMVGSLVGIGAAYAGVNLLIGGFRALTGWAVQYQQQLEGMSISLASVISATDNIPFEAAREQSGRLFEELREDALTSVATTEQLFGVAQMIYGPLHGAGQSMEQIRNMTRDTVTASTALGIPLDMASREMNQLVNGAAGMHNRLYAMLHATGAIAEDSHAWNQLTTPERVARLTSALGRFSTAADAYGHSFAGVSSTFQDIVEQFTSRAFSSSFEALRGFLDQLNTRLLNNRDAITHGLEYVGQRMGDALGHVFDNILQGFDWISANWSRLMEQGEQFVGHVRALLPELQQAAQSWVALSVGRSLFGGAISGAGGLMSLAGGMGLSLPGAAMVSTGEGAAAAGAATGVAGIVAALEGLAPLALPIAAVAAGVAAFMTTVYVHFEEWASIFASVAPMFEVIGQDLAVIGSDLWDLFGSLFDLGGTVGLAGIVVMIENFLMRLHEFLQTVQLVTHLISLLGQAFQEYIVGPITHSVLGELVAVSRGLHNVATNATLVKTSLSDLSDGLDGLRQSVIGTQSGGLEYLRGQAIGTGGLTQAFGWFTAGSAPEARAQMVQNNHFHRGAISVRQEFRDADPDRILMQMIDDVNRQAESRLTSGMTNPLTR